MSFETIMGLIMLVLIYLAHRTLQGKPVSVPTILTKEERATAEKRNTEEWDLRRLQFDAEIYKQYAEHFMEMPFDSDFVKPEYRDYFEREWQAWLNLSAFAQRQYLKRDNNVAFRNNYCTSWENYCHAFAGERMIKDRKGVPQIVTMSMGMNCYTAANPFEAATDKTWWWHWRRTHYPDLIKKYNETGIFIPGWEWKPLEEIPDYHKN